MRFLPRSRYRLLVPLLAVLVLVVGGLVAVSTGTGPAGALERVSGPSQRDRAPKPLTVRVRGALEEPKQLTVKDLAALPQRTQEVTYTAGGKPVTSTFTGPALIDVLASRKPRFDPDVKNDSLRFVVRATGDDDYRAVVSYAEIDPAYVGTEALVAIEENGTPLERPRLTVPGDARGGRYVGGLSEIRLIDLGGGGAGSSEGTSGKDREKLQQARADKREQARAERKAQRAKERAAKRAQQKQERTQQG